MKYMSIEYEEKIETPNIMLYWDLKVLVRENKLKKIKKTIKEKNVYV